MQIFFLSRSAKEAAQMACDKHVVKQIIETAQILSTVWFKVHGSKHKLYHQLGWLCKPWPNKKHPSILWVEASRANYAWTVQYWGALLSEYTNRYHKFHKFQTMHDNLVTMIPDPSLVSDDFVPMSPEYQALPVELKDEDPVVAYRAYYKRDKARFAKWAHSETPTWWLS